VQQRLDLFLLPLLVVLATDLDARLVRVRPVVGTVSALICWRWRHRAHGLLLSELGAYLLGRPGPPPVHLWERGFAGTPWRTRALGLPVRCVRRWPTRYHLVDETGQERPVCPVWQIGRGKRSWEHRLACSGMGGGAAHARWGRCPRTVGVLATMVWPPAPGPRPTPSPSGGSWPAAATTPAPGTGTCSPPLVPAHHRWYLLTTAPIPSGADAWAVVLAYARRWPSEGT
jgi:hypothetical protein